MLSTKLQKAESILTEAKAKHPEYRQYLNYSKQYTEKQQEYKTICTKIEQCSETIKELPLLIQKAEDEIKKHIRYKELKAQESQLMSASFLNAELEKIKAQKNALQTELNGILKEKSNAQQIITDYERKSSVAKFFLGKSPSIQANKRLEEIERRIPQIQGYIDRVVRLSEDYHKQLNMLLFLQEQIKHITPLDTQEKWGREKELLLQKQEQAKNALTNLRATGITIAKEMETLEAKTADTKIAYANIQSLEEECTRLEIQLANNAESITHSEAECARLLEDEKNLCHSFFIAPFNTSNREIYNTLMVAIEVAREDVQGTDLQELDASCSRLEDLISDVKVQLTELKAKIQQLEKQAIMHAKIVGTTLAKSYLSDTLRERSFDTIILDEASMASIPALWCASYLAEKNIVIVGDFLQLPPIVMADTPLAQKWLGKDVFFHSGMQELARKKLQPSNFVMLNDQFRMEEEIADIANIYYGEYGGLISHDQTDFRKKERESFYGWYSGKHTDHCVHLVDTESLHAWVTGVPQGKGHSRLNCFSATVCVDLAFRFLENKLKEFESADTTADGIAKTCDEKKLSKPPYILIVAPYKPHVVKVNQLIELEYKNRGYSENLNLIRVGTIHSFQGNEADIVIFDLVLDEPHWKANLFMPGEEVNRDLRKMFNVAVTRARFKLFVVGNFAYCRKRAKDNALSELLDKLLVDYNLVKEDAKTLLPNLAYSRESSFVSNESLNNRHIVCREDAFNEYFMADIKGFKNRLIIYSPFMAENRLSTLLPYFADAVSAGKEIIIVTKALSDHGKREQPQYRKCEEELTSLGVAVIHKKGMHEKLIFVDDDVVWMGSLNALSFTGLTGEVMQRHSSKSLTAEYQKLFDIEHICQVVEKPQERLCPICSGNAA